MGILDKLFSKEKNRDDMLLLYATETGNSKSIAKKAQKAFKKEGIAIGVQNMSKISPSVLAEIDLLFAVVSTHGEGKPPSAAKDFFKTLKSSKMRELPGLQYSVLGLGDARYDTYCKAGKLLDARLATLGALQLIPLMKADLDFEKTAKRWTNTILQLAKGYVESLDGN